MCRDFCPRCIRKLPPPAAWAATPPPATAQPAEAAPGEPAAAAMSPPENAFEQILELATKLLGPLDAAGLKLALNSAAGRSQQADAAAAGLKTANANYQRANAVARDLRKKMSDSTKRVEQLEANLAEEKERNERIKAELEKAETAAKKAIVVLQKEHGIDDQNLPADGPAATPGDGDWGDLPAGAAPSADQVRARIASHVQDLYQREHKRFRASAAAGGDVTKAEQEAKELFKSAIHQVQQAFA